MTNLTLKPEFDVPAHGAGEPGDEVSQRLVEVYPGPPREQGGTREDFTREACPKFLQLINYS